MDAKKIIYCITLFFIFVGHISSANAQKPKIVMQINPATLGIRYAPDFSDREHLYSIIDSDEIVLAVNKTMYFIKNNKIRKKIISPCHIISFDVNSNGNGLINTFGERKGDGPFRNDIFYVVKNFQVQPKPVKIYCFIKKIDKGASVSKIDMVNDSIARVLTEAYPAIFYLNINKLEDSQIKIENDKDSQFIGSNASNNYIGKYKGKHYFMLYDVEEKRNILVGRRNLEYKNQQSDILVKYDYLGEDGSEEVPIRFNSSRGVFYQMFTKGKVKILYEFKLP